MTTSSALAEAQPTARVGECPLIDVRDARDIAVAAGGLAVFADLLLHDDPSGLAFPIWIALIGLGTVALIQRCDRALPREALMWLAVAVIFSSSVAWRASDELRMLDALVAVGALGMAAIALASPRSGLFTPRLRDTAVAAIRALRNIAVGALPLVFRDLLTQRERASINGSGARIVRPAALAAGTLLVFGSLLRAADPIFASLIALPDVDMGMIVSHGLFIGFAGWIVAGWMRAALLPAPAVGVSYRVPIALGSADITAILGVLIALFSAFIAAQLGWFFGGEHFLRERTGLTVSTYARSGFFQTVWVVALVIPVLVGSRSMVLPESTLARRHTILSLPIVVLLAATIVSATLRLKLYVHFYGLTPERLYPLAFLGWLATVLAWMCVTVLRARPRAFVGGAAISGLAMLAALNVMNPDGLVARVDIDRAVHETSGMAPLDFVHLASLSGDAAPLAARAVINAPPTAAGRCFAAQTLVRRWGAGVEMRTRDERPASWRYWNAGDQYAAHAMLSYDSALRGVMHAACAPTVTPQR